MSPQTSTPVPVALQPRPTWRCGDYPAPTVGLKVQTSFKSVLSLRSLSFTWPGGADLADGCYSGGRPPRCAREYKRLSLNLAGRAVPRPWQTEVKKYIIYTSVPETLLRMTAPLSLNSMLQRKLKNEVPDCVLRQFPEADRILVENVLCVAQAELVVLNLASTTIH
jgi:hypothetical protein